MSFLSWLFGSKPTPHGQKPMLAESQPPMPQNSSPPLPEGYTDLRGLICFLEYQAPDGDITRRKVTLRAYYEEAGSARVDAFCHERQAPRTFLINRMRSIIDDDGVIHEPHEFLSETFGIQVATHRPGMALSDATICFTGRLETMKRAEAEALAREHGAKVKTHAEWTPYTRRNFLVTGVAPGSKLSDATERGITIITEREFLAMVGKL